MTEEDARLALLQSEINVLQSSILSFDAITFQIKGWCVTTSLAIGGFAVVYHRPALVLVGLASVVGFFLVNCQFKILQRVFIKRNLALDSEIRATGIIGVLKGASNVDIAGTFVPDFKYAFTSALWYEGRRPNTFTLYVFVFACLAVEAIILVL